MFRALCALRFLPQLRATTKNFPRRVTWTLSLNSRTRFQLLERRPRQLPNITALVLHRYCWIALDYVMVFDFT
jgi:hypothetical protein